MIPRVSLFIRVGQQYVKPVTSANRRIKPQYAIVDGKPTHVPTGIYYLRYKVEGKRKWESVGPDLDAALAARDRPQGGPAKSVRPAPDDVTPKSKRTPLADAAKTYLDEVALSKKPRTLTVYTTSLSYFHESCTKTCLEDLDRTDMLRFSAHLRDEREHAPRTVVNRFENVMTFLKAQGIRTLVRKTDWPNYTEEEPETYEPEELTALFTAFDSQERLFYRSCS